MEIKYIIVKDKNSRLRHLKSDWLHHGTIARDNGYSEKDILEYGVILDKELFILECNDIKHLKKNKQKYIGGRLNFYQDLRIQSWLKGRELESSIYYPKLSFGLREGD